MRKAVLILACLMLFAQAAYAHPPSRITLDYDKATGELKIDVTHHVPFPRAHFIKSIIIRLNVEEPAVEKYNMQESKEGQTLVYLIPDARAGDIISVEAQCSIFGSLSETLEVE